MLKASLGRGERRADLWKLRDGREFPSGRPR
jgi:hypothetical protein